MRVVIEVGDFARQGVDICRHHQFTGRLACRASAGQPRLTGQGDGARVAVDDQARLPTEQILTGRHHGGDRHVLTDERTRRCGFEAHGNIAGGLRTAHRVGRHGHICCGELTVDGGITAISAIRCEHDRGWLGRRISAEQLAEGVEIRGVCFRGVCQRRS